MSQYARSIQSRMLGINRKDAEVTFTNDLTIDGQVFLHYRMTAQDMIQDEEGWVTLDEHGDIETYSHEEFNRDILAEYPPFT